MFGFMIILIIFNNTKQFFTFELLFIYIIIYLHIKIYYFLLKLCFFLEYVNVFTIIFFF